MNVSVVILAAGQGVRMHSLKPKVLHTIGGVTLIERILHTASHLSPIQIVVVAGHQEEHLKSALHAYSDITWVRQNEQKGTGHAVLQSLPLLKETEQVLILSGDVPLIREATLKKLLNETPSNALGFISLKTENPTGLGRVLRNEKFKVQRIVEEKDASPIEQQVKEVNTGIYLVPKALLERWLPKLSANNAQKEYYLTDIIQFAVAENIAIASIFPQFEWEVSGVNDKIQLAKLERLYQQHIAELWMEQGVTLLDPSRFDVRGAVSIGQDVSIDINVILENVKIGNQVQIGPNVYLKNTEVLDGVSIFANSIIDGALIKSHAIIGPFARIRPETVLEPNVHVGNFVELKKSTVGTGSKISHLSYIGDAMIGSNVNIGAGTITCNYDGVHKHQTIIEDNVFIGSDTQIIAPRKIASGATIGAGTTVLQDVPANHLVHNKIQQRVVSNWTKSKLENKE